MYLDKSPRSINTASEFLIIWDKFLSALLVSIFDISLQFFLINFRIILISEGLFAKDKAKFLTPSLTAKLIELISLSVSVFKFTFVSKCTPLLDSINPDWITLHVINLFDLLIIFKTRSSKPICTLVPIFN